MPYDKGLHTMNMDEKHNVDQMFVSTVYENYEEYTKQQIHKTMDTRKLQMIMGNSSHRE